MTADAGYAFTPAQALAYSLGAPAEALLEPQDNDVVEVGLPDPVTGEVRAVPMSRRQAAERFAQAHGYLDEAGHVTDSGMQRLEFRAAHQTNMAGANWHYLSEPETAEVLARMKAVGQATVVAAAGRALGPIENEAEQRAAMARLHAAQGTNDRLMRGLA